MSDLVRKWLSQPNALAAGITAQDIGTACVRGGGSAAEAAARATKTAQEAGASAIGLQRAKGLATGAALIAAGKSLKEAAHGAAVAAKEAGAGMEEAAIVA